MRMRNTEFRSHAREWSLVSFIPLLKIIGGQNKEMIESHKPRPKIVYIFVFEGPTLHASRATNVRRCNNGCPFSDEAVMGDSGRNEDKLFDRSQIFPYLRCPTLTSSASLEPRCRTRPR